MTRLKHTVDIKQGDAANPDTWWDGKPFDRILLDAPCSATGVIRRHPDIRWLRKSNDIDNLAQLQRRILDTSGAIKTRRHAALCNMFYFAKREHGKYSSFSPTPQTPRYLL